MKQPILLILDLDETLIHATNTIIREPFDFKVGHYFVYKRPYLASFIQTCALHFKLAVWSSATDDYVWEVVRQIFPHDLELEFVWGRSRCTPISLAHREIYTPFDSANTSHFEYTKQMKKVRKLGYDLHRVLIVDDTPIKVQNCYGNAIYTKMYQGEEGDEELLLLSKYLPMLADVPNVRRVEKRLWRTQSFM